MSSGKMERFEVHIKANAKAIAKVDALLRQAEPALKTELRGCRPTPSGGKFYVLVCNKERDLDSFLFRVEQVRGAVVHKCVAP